MYLSTGVPSDSFLAPQDRPGAEPRVWGVLCPVATQDPEEQKGNREGYALAVAITTVTLVGAAFWVIAWLILDYFGA